MGKKSHKASRAKPPVKPRRPAIIAGVIAVILGIAAVVCAVVMRHGQSSTAIAISTPTSPGAKVGMVLIPGGEFVMGTDDAKTMANEHPAHKVKVDGFWMDEHDV